MNNLELPRNVKRCCPEMKIVDGVCNGCGTRAYSDDGKRYIPSAYLDEVIPEGREHPNDWIFKNAQRGVVLYNAEHDPAIAAGDVDQGIGIPAGEVVDFFWQVELAKLTATIKSDGNVWLTMPTLAALPAYYTRVCTTWGEGGKSAETVQQLGAAYADDWEEWPGVEETEITVTLWFLVEGDDKFRLVLSEPAGALQFVEERAVN